MPGGIKRFEFRPDGVVLLRAGAAPSYVLKQPLQVGNKWRGAHMSWVEIVAVGTKAKVLAGSYDGCIKTSEQRGGDRPLRIDTTFCPKTGMVLLEASSGARTERMELKSYGPPVSLGPDGVRVIR